MITFKHLSLRNFRSYKRAVLPLENWGTVLIVGINEDGADHTNSNGAGKSTIPEALIWALYGRSTKGGTGDAVIRRGAGWCAVEVQFSCKGVVYQVARTRHHPIYGTSVRLGTTMPKVKWQEGLIADIQRRIEQIIGLDYESFVQACLFAQTDARRFAEASDAERKRMLERAIPMMMTCEWAQTMAREKLQHLQNSIETSNRRTAVLQERYKAQKASHDHAQKALDLQRRAYQQQRKEATQKLAVAKHHLRATESSLEQKASKTWLETADGAPSSKVQYFEGRIFVYQKELASLAAISKSLTRQKVCPICRQSLRHSRWKHATQQLTSQIRRLQIAEALALTREAFWKRKSLRSKQLMVALDQLQSRISKLKAQCIEQRTLIHHIQKQLTHGLRTHRSPVTTEALQKLRVCISEGVEKKAHYERLSQRYKFWATGFGDRGLRSYLLDTLMGTLEKLTAHYAKQFFGPSLQIYFDTESQTKAGKLRDVLSMQIKTDHGFCQYNDLSGGERRRVDVCLAFVWRALFANRLLGGGLNVYFLDEIFDGLDQVGVERVMAQIRRETQYPGKSLFCISHLPDAENYFQKVLVVRKAQGVSEILT